MRLYTTTLVLLLTFFSATSFSFAAKVKLEVRNAYDKSICFNAKLRIKYEGVGLTKIAKLEKDGTFKFKVRNSVMVSAISEDKRYFGQVLSLNREDNGTTKVVYLYPTREHDKTLLKEDGCEITKEKPLAMLEKESEELKSVDQDNFPDQEAIFPGGTSDMKNYLGNNIRYPQMSMELGDQAKVYVEFIVNKDGSITCVQSKNKVPLHIMAESLRVIRKMPNWEPATVNGLAVRARCRIPINFKLE